MLEDENKLVLDVIVEDVMVLKDIFQLLRKRVIQKDFHHFYRGIKKIGNGSFA
jgi:hypothetical protein